MTWDEFKELVDNSLHVLNVGGGIELRRIDLTEVEFNYPETIVIEANNDLVIR